MSVNMRLWAEPCSVSAGCRLCACWPAEAWWPSSETSSPYMTQFTLLDLKLLNMVWVWFLPCFRLYSWAMCLLCYYLHIIRFSFVLYMFLWFDISFAIELEGLVVKQLADRSHWSLYCPLGLRSFSPQPLALFTKWIMFPVHLNSKSGLTCRKS